MRSVFVTVNKKQTQKLGEMLAREIAGMPPAAARRGAFIIGLEGDLGSGKTTFTQGFAKGLKIKEKILSPTFVILKKFKIHKHKLNVKNGHKYFYHLDCYRLDSPKDLFVFGFKEILKNPENIVLIEWAEKVKKILPKNCLKIKFKWVDKNKREILFSKSK